MTICHLVQISVSLKGVRDPCKKKIWEKPMVQCIDLSVDAHDRIICVYKNWQAVSTGCHHMWCDTNRLQCSWLCLCIVTESSFFFTESWRFQTFHVTAESWTAFTKLSEVVKMLLIFNHCQIFIERWKSVWTIACLKRSFKNACHILLRIVFSKQCVQHTRVRSLSSVRCKCNVCM